MDVQMSCFEDCLCKTRSNFWLKFSPNVRFCRLFGSVTLCMLWLKIWETTTHSGSSTCHRGRVRDCEKTTSLNISSNHISCLFHLFPPYPVFCRFMVLLTMSDTKPYLALTLIPIFQAVKNEQNSGIRFFR